MIYKDFMDKINKTEKPNIFKKQIQAYELKLKETKDKNGNYKYKEVTIRTKIKHLIDYILKVNELKKDIQKDEDFDPILFLNDYALDYVKYGDFNSDFDNVGTVKYREDIFRNIREGINFILEDTREYEIISPLNKEEREGLKKFDNPKFIKQIDERVCLNDIQNIEKKILEDIGIELHIDKNGKGYVYSHELAKILDIKPKHINEKLKQKCSNYQKDLEEFDGGQFFDHLSNLDFTMDEDYREETNKNGITQKSRTFKIGKDLLFSYILSLNSNTKDEVRVAQYKYQLAFNTMKQMIEDLLKERIENKKECIEYVNTVRKDNRNKSLKILKLEKRLG